MDSLLKELKEALDSVVEGMSNEQMKWHPAGKWSAAEVLEHLYPVSYTHLLYCRVTFRPKMRVIFLGCPMVRFMSSKRSAN